MHPNHHQPILFASSIAVILACVERASVVSTFLQFHMWVFLSLNLLLIAILFTSTHPHSKPQEPDKKQPLVVADHRDTVVYDGFNILEELKDLNASDDDERKDGGVEDQEDDDDDEVNKRAEAFISRFRQQYLVSNVVKIRSGTSGSVFMI